MTTEIDMSAEHVQDEPIEYIQSEEDDIEVGTPLYQIRSYPSDPDLETLHLRWRRGDIIIPEFQRGFVWKPAQASRLIESFLMGLPVPGIFVFVEGQNRGEGNPRQLVIDGQQRLRSVFGFFEGKLPGGRNFRLSGVDERWQGKEYKDLEYWERNLLLTSILRVVNIEQREPQNDSSSIYQIFERLNTGGTALTPQEIRNSSYHGPFNDMLANANKDSVWRDIFGPEQLDPRMRDIELIARFLALYEGSDSYVAPMKKFINDYMGKHQWQSNPEERQRVFLDSVHRVVASLGKRPFHVPTGHQCRGVRLCDDRLRTGRRNSAQYRGAIRRTQKEFAFYSSNNFRDDCISHCNAAPGISPGDTFRLMLQNAYVAGQCSKIEESIQYAIEKSSRDSKLNAYLAGYISVLISGLVEDSVEHLVTERARITNDSQLQEFVRSSIARRFRNPRSEDIANILGEFSPDYRNSYSASVTLEAREALGSIVANRMSLAHQGTPRSPFTVRGCVIYPFHTA